MPVLRHFLPWDKPLLPQMVAWLARDWRGDGPLDLRGLLVVVPTKQSGRRLREALAEYAAKRGQAVFPPEVATAEGLILREAVTGQAGRLESLLAWIDVLRDADPAAFRELFPMDPPARSFSWALRLADQFLRVQATLAEAGLRMAGVVAKAGSDFPEPERWEQLGELERRYDARLRRKGLTDSQAAKIDSVRDPGPITGVERIILAGVPDPVPLALTAIEVHARRLPVDVVVFAPPSEGDAFDSWGLPIVSTWARRVLDLPDFDTRVRLCADPSAQADEIAAWAGDYGKPEGLLAVGVGDSEVASALESALGRAGFEVFNPEGRPWRRDELFHLLTAISAFAREPTFEAVEALGRCPAFLAFLARRLGEKFSAARWLAGLDELRLRHLPASLAEARAHAAELSDFPEIEPGLAAVEALRATLAAPDFASGASAALGLIFAGRRLDFAHPSDARLAEAAEAWRSVLRGYAGAAPSLPAADAWEIALRILGEGTGTADKPAGAIELQGWLELLWEDALHLVIAGMNDGSVPEAIAGDPFLPESLRQMLGLKTNAARLARDAYLLQALAACRAASGRVDLLFGKASAAGDPLRPSRLLLRCADTELPRRVATLFRPVEVGRAHLAWSRAWQITPPPPIQAPSRIAVTALRDWLACPFRFYLRHILNLAPLDPAKSELDERDFGTLCHGALEALGRSEEMRDCTHAARLREFLSAELDRRMRERFGKNLSLPLIIQLDSARQRLGRAAEIQARERAAGWRIVEVEKKISVEIGGLVIRGKIDRIDRHLETGAARLLDYKTSDKPASPADVHLGPPRPGVVPEPWRRLDGMKRPRVWTDLQLPFYQLGLTAELPIAAACGYFNLPKAVGEAGIELWKDYSPELQASALDCAENVCRAIGAGAYWPPNEDFPARRDDFAALFHHGAAASVDWKERS